MWRSRHKLRCATTIGADSGCSIALAPRTERNLDPRDPAVCQAEFGRHRPADHCQPRGPLPEPRQFLYVFGATRRTHAVVCLQATSPHSPQRPRSTCSTTSGVGGGQYRQPCAHVGVRFRCGKRLPLLPTFWAARRVKSPYGSHKLASSQSRRICEHGPDVKVARPAPMCVVGWMGLVLFWLKPAHSPSSPIAPSTHALRPAHGAEPIASRFNTKHCLVPPSTGWYNAKIDA